MFGNKSTKAEAPKKQPPATVRPQSAPRPAPSTVQAPPNAELANYISAGTVIEGNIVSSEDLQIDGTVKGDIQTTAKLILGEDSIVEGNIVAEEAEVSGRIQGTVQTKGLLAIKRTCVIDGDIVTKSLNVESGSSFNGRCKVGAGAGTGTDRTEMPGGPATPQKLATTSSAVSGGSPVSTKS